MAQGDGGIVVALDFRKAFDTVRFDKLIIAMNEAGVKGQALEWIKSWAYDNQFQVKIGDKLSQPRKLISSVKQGSCLGPLGFIVFINSLLEDLSRIKPSNLQNTTYGDLTERVHFQCYADDITLITQFPKGTKNRKKHVEDLMQQYLDVCEDWSKRWGLFFNPGKCEWAPIGIKRANIDFNLTLYGQKLTMKKYVKILGLVIEGKKQDPLERMEDIMRSRFRLITRQLRTFIKDGSYKETKSLYHTIMISRTLYASEAWSTATVNTDAHGKISEMYEKDGEGLTQFTLPLYAKTSKECYLKWMGTKTVSDDIRRYKKKRWIRSFHDIPLLPIQIAIQKDLSLIFDIIDPKTCMDLAEFLEPPNGDGRTRSSLMSIMEKAIKNRTINHQKRNLFRRHQRILLWLYNNNCIGPLLMMKKKQRRKIIGKLLGEFET